MVLAIGGLSSVHAAPGDVYENEIKPILQKHCYECHGPERMKGDLDLTTFSDYDEILEAKEAWQTVYERVQAFEMPPKGIEERRVPASWETVETVVPSSVLPLHPTKVGC